MSDPRRGEAAHSVPSPMAVARARPPAAGLEATKAADADEAADTFAALVAAHVPVFCDDVRFDLIALDSSAQPAGADAEAPQTDVRVEHSRAPGCIAFTVHSPPIAGEPAIEGTVTCTWTEQGRPTDIDVIAAGMLAEQAVARMRLAGLAHAVRVQRIRAANLELALATNREIGQAIGILMATEQVTADQAFDRLRSASQHLHRKLREIAADVVETGILANSAAPATASAR
jgi:hypothetical protein